MPPSVLIDQPPRPRRARRWVAAVAIALAAPWVAVSTGAPPAAGAPPSTEGSDITVVQANLLSPQHYTRFQRDAKEVLALQPDLITYNEVAFRKDEYLAPKGYQLWRTPGQYTGPTPVAWRTDAWQLLDRGTRNITDWRGKPPGRTTELGRRYANWVTLKSDEGRVLSVVSIHVAPKVRGMPDLRRRSVKRLGRLVERLSPHGPVLVGGDFNIHYRSQIYPADLFAAAQLKPTYEILGNHFPTGDHGGHTIDYVFVRSAGQLQVDTHYPVELNSDHDAVVAGLSWTTDPPTSVTEVRNDPDGTRAERRAVASAVVRAIRDAAAGDVIDVATRGTDLRPVRRALVGAHERGVDVQLLTRSPQLTDQERRLRALFRGTAGSWVRQCLAECSQEWEETHAPSVILVSDAQQAPRLLVEVSKRLRSTVVTRRTRATLSTGSLSLEDARQAFARY